MSPSDKPGLVIVDGQPMTTTLVLAEQLGMSHVQVLRRVQAALRAVPADFGRENFLVAGQLDAQGHPQPMYRLTRAGVEYVAMEVGGDRGLRCLVAYTEAFRAATTELYRGLIDAAAATASRHADPAAAPAGTRPPRDLLSCLLPSGISAEEEAELRAVLGALIMAATAADQARSDPHEPPAGPAEPQPDDLTDEEDILEFRLNFPAHLMGLAPQAPAPADSAQASNQPEDRSPASVRPAPVPGTGSRTLH